jgi:hypothetical protein
MWKNAFISFSNNKKLQLIDYALEILPVLSHHLGHLQFLRTSIIGYNLPYIPENPFQSKFLQLIQSE